MLADYEITKSIKITNTVVLDLNGFKVTGPDDGKANWYAFIVDGGDLTLKDSVGTGELYAKCYGIETKAGKFTLDGAKITATKNGKVGTAIVNYGGEVVINGGELSGNLAAVFTAGHFADATTTIKGGTINGEVAIDEDCGPEDEEAGGTIHEDRAESVSSTSPAYEAGEGYKWVEENGVYVLTACEYVAEADGVKYETLWKKPLQPAAKLRCWLTMRSPSPLKSPTRLFWT